MGAGVWVFLYCCNATLCVQFDESITAYVLVLCFHALTYALIV